MCAARASARHYLRIVPVDWNSLPLGAFHDATWANLLDGSSNQHTLYSDMCCN